MAHTTPHRSLPTLARGWGHGGIPVELAVARYDRRLRSVARSYGLGPFDVDDVLQSTWLQLIEHGHELRERAALGAWLETTARRLSLRLLRTLLLRPHLSYEEVGRRLAMPIGSIGPTRARCMHRLRLSTGLRALQA